MLSQYIDEESSWIKINSLTLMPKCSLLITNNMYNVKSNIFTLVISTFFACKWVSGMLNYNNSCLLKQWIKKLNTGALTLKLLIVVQFLILVWLFVTPWNVARQASLSFTISQSLLKLISIESVMPSNHLILCHPLLLLPSVFPSNRVFSNQSALRFKVTS